MSKIFFVKTLFQNGTILLKEVDIIKQTDKTVFTEKGKHSVKDFDKRLEAKIKDNYVYKTLDREKALEYFAEIKEYGIQYQKNLVEEAEKMKKRLEIIEIPN